MAIRFKSEPEVKMAAASEKPMDHIAMEKAAKKIERKGKAKQWGVRLDEAYFDLVKRNSRNHGKDAEAMIEIYASIKGWE